MPYGTESFTDRYGDYKQPTIIDMDRQINTYNNLTDKELSEEDIKEISVQHNKDIEDTLKEILSINPFFGNDTYKYLVITKENKLSWDIDKILDLKKDVNWLLELRRYLNKNKLNYLRNSKPI